MSDLILMCPNCGEFFITNENEINCTIYRHGVLKNNYLQINPHSTELECDNYINNGEIYGCGKPFKIILIENKYHTIICDYI